MAIKLDFTGVEDRAFEPWPANEPIEFTLQKITPGKTKKGDDKLEFEFQHIDSKRKAWRTFTLTPNAMWALKKLLVEMGAPKESLAGKFNFEPRDVIGVHVYLTFEEPEEYEGKPSQSVDTVTVVEGQGEIPWTDPS